MTGLGGVPTLIFGMEKPKGKTTTYYDYTLAADYIAEKYGYGPHNDFLREGEERFRSHLLDIGVHNGSFYSIMDCDDEDDPEWIRRIERLFLEEFGYEVENGKRRADFHVTW